MKHVSSLTLLYIASLALANCDHLPTGTTTAATSAAQPVSEAEREAPRFVVVAAGERVIKLDSVSGKSWVLDANSRQWLALSDQRVGKYNAKTGKIEWEGENTEASSQTMTSPSDPLGLFTPEENAKRAGATQSDQ